ncbi:hypothetical protein [uncultured Pelagimonas sp.]|uniref:hypothetical protein n=1 Tax=uncultured Pelagimonas sp. TaxID=1618102 RepID=UPI0026169715|nr:hypothetical protein [uncultured Pelagimonas sp.]
MFLRSTFFAAFAIALQASTVNSAVAGAEQDVEKGSDAWVAMRAQIFAQVCMASAPSFVDVDAKAKDAGLQDTDSGWHMPPEVLLDVIEHDSFCSCFMTTHAPDQDAMIGAIHGQLMQGFGTQFSGPDSGLATVAPFQMGDQEVVSILEPRDFGGEKWVAARLSVFGPCQTEEVTE